MEVKRLGFRAIPRGALLCSGRLWTPGTHLAYRRDWSPTDSALGFGGQ